MNLANPSALLWLLLVIPVVVFYVLKIRLKRVPVSTTLFWQQIFDEKKPRSLWQRLRHLASLLVQLLLVGLLVAALAEPFFAWEARSARRVVLVLDNSASMSATDVAPSRLAQAKVEAGRVIRRLRSRDELAVVSAGTQPRVVCGLTGHQQTLRAAVEGVEATDGPTVLAEAVAVARRLVADAGDGREGQIVVVTDGCSQAAAGLAADPLVQLVPVGGRAANVGITRFQVRRSGIDPVGYEILAEVTNPSDEPVDNLRLVISLNGNPVDIKPLKLAPGQKWSRVSESTTADGGLLVAELMAKGEKKDEPYPDALAADNRATAVLPKRDPVPVHLYSPTGSLFLQKVLEAHPLARVTTHKELPDQYPAGAVLVFHRRTPAKLPPGNVLVVDPETPCDLWTVGDKLTSPLVTQQDKESPLMAHVRLDNMLLPEARKLAFTPAAGKPQVLAGAVGGEPLFARIDRADGPAVVLTVNLDLGDLPFRTAFPILATNTLGSFTGGADLRESLAAGATAEIELPATGAFELRPPAGPVRALPTGGGKVTLGPFDQCGVWAVSPVDATGDGKPLAEYAVNLMSAAESDLRPPDGLTTTAPADPGPLDTFRGRPVWWYLLGAALVFVTVEWFLYQRRYIS